MRTLLFAPLALALGACNGTDVGNPPRGELTHFDTTPCKKANADKGVDPLAAWQTRPALHADRSVTLPAWQPDPQLYSGLTCVLWETVGDVLRVRLTNHQAGCHEDVGWKPLVELRDARVDLILDNPECKLAGCGNCIYDVAFDVRLGQEQREAAQLSLRVLGNDCSGERPVQQALELSGAERTAGARCSYTFHGLYDALDFGASGGLRSPCGTAEHVGPISCAQDSVCAPVDDYSLCLAPCSADEECRPEGVMACVDGLCRLRVAP